MIEQALSSLHLAATNCVTRTGFLPSLYDGLTCKDGSPVITSVQNGFTVVWNVVRILIALSGGLAVIALVAGGIYFVISAGDPAKVKRGKDIINNSIVGLVLIIAAYAVVTFIASGF